MVRKIGLIVVVLFFIVTFFNFLGGKFQRKALHFSGVIEKIRYDKKMIPIVTVNGKSYYLSALGSFHKEVNVGDSVVKHRGDLKLKIVKRDGEILKYEL